MPIYFASVFAVEPDRFPGEVKEIRIYGDLNQTMALRPDSRIYVDVIVRQSGMSPSRLTFTDGQPFNTCVPHPDGSICSLIISPPTALIQGIKEYRVTYYPLAGSPYSLSGSYVADGTPPVITSFSASPSLVGPGEVTISYSGIDYAGAYAAYCSGIAGFEIASDPLFQNIVTTVPVGVADLEDCAKSGTIKIATPTLSGQYIWYARAYDRLGNFQYSFSQTSFEVDADAPEVVDVHLFRDGVEINYTGIGADEYEFVVEIREENGLEGVPSLDIAAGSGNCRQLGDSYYECSYRVIASTTSTSRKISGILTAEDTLGNTASVPVEVGIQIDADAPVIAFFGSDYGEYLRHRGNTLKLHAVEQDSGYNKRTVYADLHLINPAYGTVRNPDECSGEWCYWYNITTTKLSGSYNARVYVTDFLGHRSFADIDFIIDRELPQITEIIHEPEYPTAEDTLIFALNATDNKGILEAHADVSDISTYDGLLEGDCDGEGICVFEAQELKTYAVPGDIIFTVTDLAGNNASEIYQMTLFEADVDAIPNEIEVRVGEILPSSLPKEIALSIPTKLYLGLDVSTRGTNAEIVGAGTVNCPGLQSLSLLSTSLPRNPYLFGNEYIVFEILLDNATAALSHIDLNCTVDFIVKRGSKIFYNPERENIFARVDVKSISTIDNSMISHLKDLKDLIEDDLDWATDTDKFLRSVTKICDSFAVFKDAYNVLNALKPALYVIFSVLYIYTEEAANKAWKGYNALVCYFAVAKNYAWPNTNPDNIGDMNQETFSGLWEDWDSTRGWVRNICAFVKCRQCNTDWGVVNRLANLNFETGEDVWDIDQSDSQTRISRLNGTVFEGADLSVEVDPFKSWAVSLLCLCLPGIVHNIHKYRQMECMHARCLIESAKLGQSASWCDKEDEVRKCIFWWGGLLHIVPFYLFSKMILTKIERVLSNWPAYLTLAVRNKLCDVYDRSVQDRTVAAAGTDCKATQKGRAQDMKDCEYECMPNIPDAGTSWQFITCSLIDTGLLIWAWDDMIDNAFDSERYEWDVEEEDFCENIDWTGIE